MSRRPSAWAGPMRAAETLGQRPNRAETATANFAQFAVQELQHGVDRWADRWAALLPVDALRELYETIGWRRKP